MRLAAIKIARFMSRHDLNDESFGEMVGVSPHTIKKYRNSERLAISWILMKIKQVTNGYVKEGDWYKEAE